ncbi:MAG: hypothetical protein ACAH21_15430 [Ramlibacter sp.]|nr:hypothetical protein [Ramlibacter sp.]
MKAYYLLAPLGLAILTGCTVYRPTPVAYVAPTPTYVQPSTVIMGAPAAIIDSDGDGYADSVDRWPNDARYH